MAARDVFYGRIKNFLQAYGERGLIVLKTAYEIATDPEVDHRLGDFSYKHVVSRLLSAGYNYNPANLLNIMEKRFGIIERTYSSHNQTWWQFTDISSVREVLREQIAGSSPDPRVRLLLVKYKSLEPSRIYNTLRNLSAKERFTEHDKAVFRKIVFEDLDRLTAILSEMENYAELFSGEIKMIQQILWLSEVVADKMSSPNYARPTIHLGSSEADRAGREIEAKVVDKRGRRGLEDTL